MSDRDLKLNSLSRFSKKSPRLVLEEYGHCEVPAGCGGVVLRWRKAEAPIPMHIHHWSGNGYSSKSTLDGKDELFNPKVPVDYGRHVLTMEITKFNPVYAFILLYAEFNADYLRILQPLGDVNFVSLPDGSWRYSFDTPPANWTDPHFDDSLWLPCVEKPLNPQPKHYMGDISEWTSRYLERGAKALGIDSTESSVAEKIKTLTGAENLIDVLYIRKTFTINPKAE